MNTATQLSKTANTEPEINFSIPETLNVKEFVDRATSLDVQKGTTDFGHASQIETPKLAPRYLKPLKGSFRLLQMWEGYVTDIDQTTFSAIISDKTNSELPDELVTLDIEEISPCDLALLQPGAVFYWSIRYADLPGRGRSKESKIRFRRLPTWTKKEIDRAIKTGTELATFFE